jgi:hypothetical protein
VTETRGGVVVARDGSTRDRSTGSGGSGARPSARRAGPRRPPEATPAVPADGLVVGDPPLLARLTGVLLVLAGLAGAAGLFPTYLVVGGTEVSQSAGAVSLLAGLLVPVTAAAVGGGLVAGRVPRLGLAYAGIGGALALGLLLIELYRASTSTIRPGIEVIAGQRVLTSSVDVGPGWLLGVVALGLTVLAGVLGVAAWGRTVMDDAGTLDPVRPALAGAAAVLGVAAVLCLVLPPPTCPTASSPTRPPGSRSSSSRRARRDCSNVPASRCSGGCCSPEPSSCARCWPPRCGHGWPRSAACSPSPPSSSRPGWAACATPWCPTSWGGRCPASGCCWPVSATSSSRCWPGGCAGRRPGDRALLRRGAHPRRRRHLGGRR